MAVNQEPDYDPIFDGHPDDKAKSLRAEVKAAVASTAVDAALITAGTQGIAYEVVPARRGAYYSQLGEGLLEYVGPLIEAGPREKAITLPLAEINASLNGGSASPKI